jgi:hypothetical protein
MKCHTNDNSTSSTRLPHKFSYMVAILGHNHFESPNMYYYRYAQRHLDLLSSTSIETAVAMANVPTWRFFFWVVIKIGIN